MLHALYERGIAPDVVVGTSAGAINGAFIASRPQTVETADELAAIWRGCVAGRSFRFNPLSGLLGFVGSRDHLVPGSSLRKLVAEHDHVQRLEEMPIEFHVVAVDVLTGEELLLSRGPALDAVMASAAIPAVLPPVEWEGRAADGRRRGQQHADLARGGARRARGLRAADGHACALEQPPASALGMALHALTC